jgi:hypothetical protein
MSNKRQGSSSSKSKPSKTERYARSVVNKELLKVFPQWGIVQETLVYAGRLLQEVAVCWL